MFYTYICICMYKENDIENQNLSNKSLRYSFVSSVNAEKLFKDT